MTQVSHLFPRRIICLTEETTETLYAIGADDLIVGVSGFTVRPKRARKEKKTISTYLDAKFDDILALQPDIVFAWSDLQADICQELIKRGIEVVCFNHRTIQGVFSMIYRLGILVGKQSETEKYIETLESSLARGADFAQSLTIRTKVYFEEWYDPLITGIAWVSELIEHCGGIDLFAENRQFPDAKRRILADASLVVDRNPDIIIASWCGKMFKPEKMRQRPHWETINAIQHSQVHEIHSSIILQPGPAALTDGVEALISIYSQWQTARNIEV